MSLLSALFMKQKKVHYDSERYRYQGYGKVVGEFICDKIERFSIPYPAYFSEVDKHTRDIIANACLTLLETHEYLGRKNGYAWHISDLKVYDKPKELSEFKLPAKDSPKCGYSRCSNAVCGWFDNCQFRIIKRPPQSWCYCESLEEVDYERDFV